MAGEDAAEATRLLQALAGRCQAGPCRSCVGVGDLQMRFEAGLSLTLENAVRADAHGSLVESYSPAGMALLLPLLNCAVTEAFADGRGSLALTLDGMTVQVLLDRRDPPPYPGSAERPVG